MKGDTGHQANDVVKCATEMARSWRRWAIEGGMPPSAVKTATTIEALLAEYRKMKLDCSKWRRRACKETVAPKKVRSEV